MFLFVSEPYPTWLLPYLLNYFFNILINILQYIFFSYIITVASSIKLINIMKEHTFFLVPLEAGDEGFSFCGGVSCSKTGVDCPLGGDSHQKLFPWV